MTFRRNILASWIAHAIALAIGLFLMPFILHTLGDDAYGVWVFVSSIAGYSGLLYMGFGATICKYVSQESARENWSQLSKVVSTIFCFYLAMAALVVLGAIAFAAVAPSMEVWGGTSTNHVQLAILIIGCSTAIGMAGSVYGGILIGTQRFDLKRAIEVATGLARVVLVVFFLNQQQGIVVLAAVFLAVTFLEQVLYVLCARRVAPQVYVRIGLFRKQTFRECASFSTFTAIGSFSEQLIYLTDTIVIGFVLGPRAVVPYYVGLRLCQMIRLPIEQVAEVTLPKAGALYATGRTAELHRLMSLGMGLCQLLAGGLLIGSIFFGPQLIETWVGPGYEASYHVLVILMVAQVTALPMHVVRKTLLGAGRVKLSSLIDLAEAVCNLALSLVLIRHFGIIGVAWGTLIPLVVIELGVLLPCAAHQLELPVKRMLRNCVAGQIVPLGALVAYCVAVSQWPIAAGWVPLLAVSAGGGTVLGLTWWLQRWFVGQHFHREGEAPAEPTQSVIVLPSRGSAGASPSQARVPVTSNR